jgi:virulence factor Mce-like protein
MGATLRKRFEFRPGMYRQRHVRNGLVALALFALALFILYTGGKIPLLPKGGYTIKANFASSANVSAGKTPVRIKGIKVGEVEKVERQPGGRGVQITMRIDDDKVKLRPDAQADIYWRTLLGFQFYIQLDPGSLPGTLKGPIPESRTTVQTELDQVLQAVNPPSRAGIRTTIQQFDKGFNGNSPAGRVTDALGPAMKQIAPGVQALRGLNPGDLTELVRQAGDLTGVLRQDETSLGGLIKNADVTLGVTAARRADLGQILHDGPQTLSDTRNTMIRLRSTLDILDPVVEQLRPGVRRIAPMSAALRPALRELNPTLDDARPLLTKLRPALSHLGSASTAGISFMNRTTASLNRANSSILPDLNAKDPDIGIKFYEEIGPTVATVNDSAKEYDANGFMQRFHAFASGTRALGFVPCTANLAQLSLNCDDVQNTIAELLGMPAARGASHVRTVKDPAPQPASGGNPAAAAQQAVQQTADQAAAPAAQATGAVTNLLGEILGGGR